MPDQVPQDEAENTGPDLSVLLGRIIEAMKLDVSSDADAATVLQAIYEKVSGGEGDGEDDSEAAATAAELRKVFKLDANAGTDAILAAAHNAHDKLAHTGETVATLSEQVKTLQAAQTVRDVDMILAEYTKAGKINPNDTKQIERCKAFAERDLKEFRAFMDAQPAAMPAGGHIGGPDEAVGGDRSRSALIKASKTEFTTDPSFAAQGFSERSVINLDLRDAGLEPLTDDEVRECAVAS